ncbi:MAG: 2-(1,2-epoxy-1,2-dihydrophenyl)acetyl-CoA isomerase PaaG [Alphaproteobacteria bacterium]|nr:2-(1,2-epoxy-1,2-dihydrophenyl)acetyl-CoA isomerase PaaG [Alphaproteobacteria bacterium]
MNFKTILWDVQDGIATLTLNRPDRLNAFTAEMHGELRQVMEMARADGAIRCLLVTGAGRGFCAGADLTAGLGDVDADGPDLGMALERDYNPLILAMRRLPKPILAAVNGPAAGAGMSLALACDLVIAARSATFLQAFCNIGLVPDAGSTYFLPRLAGSARAAYLTMMGEKLPAETAAEWGLIWKCVDDETLMGEAMSVARKLASGPTKGLSLIKDALNRSAGNDLAGQLGVERDLQRQAGRTRDFQEGVRAFLEKRPARFEGR